MQIFKNTVVAKESEIQQVIKEVDKVITFIILNHCELRSLWTVDFAGEARRHTRSYAVVKDGVFLFNFEIRIWKNHAYIMHGRTRRTPLSADAYNHGYHWVPTTLNTLRRQASPKGEIIQGGLYEFTEW
jgi:hypothetical protein